MTKKEIEDRISKMVDMIEDGWELEIELNQDFKADRHEMTINITKNKKEGTPIPNLPPYWETHEDKKWTMFEPMKYGTGTTPLAPYTITTCNNASSPVNWAFETE